MQNGRWTCPNVANTMQNDKFKFQTVANTRQMVPAKKSKKKTQTCSKKNLKLFHTHILWFCVAGIAGDAAALCVAGVALGVAGVALGVIYFGLAWQAWHLATSTFVLRGRRGTCGIGLALLARLDRISRRWRRGILRGRCGTWRHLLWFCVAGVALMALGRLWWRGIISKFVWKLSYVFSLLSFREFYFLQKSRQ